MVKLSAVSNAHTNFTLAIFFHFSLPVMLGEVVCMHKYYSGFLNRIQVEQSHNIWRLAKTTLVLLPVITSQIHHVDQSVAIAVKMKSIKMMHS